MNKLLSIVVLSVVLASPIAMADALKIGADDTMQSVLTGQKDKRVTLRLKSGVELTGKLSNVGKDVVQLSGLSGREYFDAVVPVRKIEAVIVRTKK